MNKNGGRAAHYTELAELHERIRAADLEGYLLSAAQSIETAVERATELRAAVDRQMAALATDAEKWRAAATLSHVDAALTKYPEVRSVLLRIGQTYDRMAASVKDLDERHLKKRSAA
jgi:ribosomal protein L17